LLLILTGLWCAALAAGAAAAEDAGLTRVHHPWGRFEPGAWKMVRVITETLDEQGTVSSTTNHDTRTLLQRVDPESVSLEVAVTVEVAGKRFETEPQVVRQPYHSEMVGGNAKAKAPVDTTITIEGREYRCRMVQLEYTGPNNSNKTTTNIYYSDAVAPYVLRRETTTTDAEGAATLNEAIVEVAALELPWRASGEIKSAALVKSTVKHAKGSTITWAFTSPDVPGGVMSHTSKELDSNGRTLRRSTLELIDYGLQCEEEPAGLFRLKRRARMRE
jgi:hypothetical protein